MLLVAERSTDREALGQARRDSVAALRLRVVSTMDRPVRRKNSTALLEREMVTAGLWPSGVITLVSDPLRNKY